MRDASTPDALTCARRRLLTNSAGIAAGQTLSDDQLCKLADPDWTPPVIENIDTHVIECADPILRALLSESLSDTLSRLLALERPHGSFDDTADGHEAFTRTVLEDYDHGNQHLARAMLRPAQPDHVVLLGLECLGIPADALTIIGELAHPSNRRSHHPRSRRRGPPRPRQGRLWSRNPLLARRIHPRPRRPHRRAPGRGHRCRGRCGRHARGADLRPCDPACRRRRGPR